MEINKLLMYIFENALAINSKGKHQIFLDIAPHVSQISIRIFNGGWVEGKTIDLKLECYYDGVDAIRGLGEIALTLIGYRDEESLALLDKIKL